MHDGDNYMVSIKSSRLSEQYILCVISIKSSRLYVPIKWLPLVNSWSLWSYTLADIFNHFNCSISIAISLNIASKGQLKRASYCIGFNRWQAIIWTNDGLQWCIYMRHSTSLDIHCRLTLHVRFQAIKGKCWFELFRKKIVKYKSNTIVS